MNQYQKYLLMFENFCRQRPRLPYRKGCGQHSCRLLGRDVLREPFCSRRREDSSRSGVQRRQSERTAGEVQESFARLVQGAPSSLQGPASKAFGMRHGNDLDLQRETPDGFEASGRPRYLPVTWRKHRLEKKRHHPSSQKFWAAVLMVFSDYPGHGGLETGQDWNLRQQGPGVSGRPVVSPCKVASQPARSVVPFHQRRLPETISEGLGVAGSKGPTP